MPDHPRRAPSVAVDPAAELPASEPTAHTERGLVVLVAPSDPERAKAVVWEFFTAMLEEDADALDQLIDAAAWVETGTQGSRQSARSFYKARIAQLDYRALGGASPYRRDDVEVYTAEDLARLPPGRRPRERPDPGQVLLRVPLTTPQAGHVRLFGDELWFRLERGAERFKIVSMQEDYRLP